MSGFIAASSVDTSKTTEDIQVPKSLMFLRDIASCSSNNHGYLHALASIIAGGEFVETVSSGSKLGCIYLHALHLCAGGAWHRTARQDANC
ncbi:hypothetical protein O9992_25850 [Vibrio lentus]|nr:hypothetical protein [Vibrio lentus]